MEYTKQLSPSGQVGDLVHSAVPDNFHSTHKKIHLVHESKSNNVIIFPHQLTRECETPTKVTSNMECKLKLSCLALTCSLCSLHSSVLFGHISSEVVHH